MYRSGAGRAEHPAAPLYFRIPAVLLLPASPAYPSGRLYLNVPQWGPETFVSSVQRTPSFLMSILKKTEKSS